MTPGRYAYNRSEHRRERRKAYDAAYNAKNPTKKQEMQAAYQKAKPEKWREYYKKHRKLHVDYYRDWNLKNAYGITLEQYEAIIQKQEGKCLICHDIPKRLFVDHNHETGVVRGLLCRKCNSGLGMFKESIAALQRAQEYIRGSLS